jgi:hypothetical protein
MKTSGTARAGWLAMVTSLAIGQTSMPELRKPAPDAQALPNRERLETLIEQRYPRLLTEKMSGVVMVMLLFEPDGSLSGTNLEIVPQTSGPGPLTASEAQFARFGLAAGDLRYIGVSRVRLSLNTILVVFGAKDSRQLDHALVERFFPKALIQGLPGGFGIWILFDHEGRVLKSGQESVAAATLRETLENRFPGIRTQAMAVTPVAGRSRRGLKDAHVHLQLYSVWLAADSPLPAAARSDGTP